MRRHEILIFFTGAVTLALEVLASRIMMPYFGVSLYIWSGILSTTLAFLAIGYWLGGRWSRRLEPAAAERRLLWMPVVAAAALAAGAAIFPVVFPILAQASLIGGSFVAAILLLAIPLIALSALNPLLIGLQRGHRGGDGGAGRVFFISTVGSVVGVLVTAFVFIPNLANYSAVLALGLALALAAVVFADAPGRRRLLIPSAVVAVPLLALLIGRDSYLDKVSPMPGGGVTFRILDEFTSMFGSIKVVELGRDGRVDDTQKMFVQDGLLQNRTTADNASLSSYTHVLYALAGAYAPEAKDALVLGLGAGIVPMQFKGRGLDVAVVEINADAVTAATRHFGFDAAAVRVHLADARTHVRRCRADYDVAIVDLFLGDNTPDYLLTREFFADLKRCLRPDGVVVMNAFLDDSDDAPNRRLLATVMAAFPRVFRYGLAQGNSYIVGTTGRGAAEVAVDAAGMPEQVRQTVVATVGTRREIRPEYYVGFEPVGDDDNIFSVLFANAQMKLRRALVTQLPSRLLVN